MKFTAIRRPRRVRAPVISKRILSEREGQRFLQDAIEAAAVNKAAGRLSSVVAELYRRG